MEKDDKSAVAQISAVFRTLYPIDSLRVFSNGVFYTFI